MARECLGNLLAVRHDDDIEWKSEKYLCLYATPLHKHNITQGQFLKWSLTGLNSVFFFLGWLLYQGYRTPSALLFAHSWRENSWIHTFSKGISTMWNANSFILDLNSSCHAQFLNIYIYIYIYIYITRITMLTLLILKINKSIVLNEMIWK